MNGRMDGWMEMQKELNKWMNVHYIRSLKKSIYMRNQCMDEGTLDGWMDVHRAR